MKANEFVKKFGITKASKLVVGYPNAVACKFYNYDFEKEHGKHDEVCLADLKRLVESHELVEKHGGIDSLNGLFYVHGMNSARVMKVGSLTYARAMQAIADVESCQ